MNDHPNIEFVGYQTEWFWGGQGHGDQMPKLFDFVFSMQIAFFLKRKTILLLNCTNARMELISKN